MSRWDGLNRRKFPRVNYPCLVVLRDTDQEAGILLTHTENIGIGGVCVILKQNVKMFSLVDLELDLLDLGDHIKCEGKVVWNVQRKMDESKKPLYYDVGIEFEVVDEKNKERLDTIVKRLVKNNRETPYTR
ncbi:MAG: Tfp pilus assembly protein PilZ [Lysobacterales bacterium]|jgi:Tfp pilus assembly protein PilZ